MWQGIVYQLSSIPCLRQILRRLAQGGHGIKLGEKARFYWVGLRWHVFLPMVFMPGEMDAFLTDTTLQHPKPQGQLYQSISRDGLYVAVTPACSISFHHNNSINGRQETVTLGRYRLGGITLA